MAAFPSLGFPASNPINLNPLEPPSGLEKSCLEFKTRFEGKIPRLARVAIERRFGGNRIELVEDIGASDSESPVFIELIGEKGVGHRSRLHLEHRRDVDG